MAVLLIALGALALVAVAGVVSFNRFVDERQTITNSWSNVDTELQRRHDLTGNLVETVKGYAAHERTTLEAVLQARAAAVRVNGADAPPAAAKAVAEGQLAAGLRRVLALGEAYPDLQASGHFLELQHALAATENRIQAARRVYNGNVREYNRRIESVPSNLIARLGGFARAEYFELDAVITTAAPTIRL
jgi:LemA protein